MQRVTGVTITTNWLTHALCGAFEIWVIINILHRVVSFLLSGFMRI